MWSTRSRSPAPRQPRYASIPDCHQVSDANGPESVCVTSEVSTGLRDDDWAHGSADYSHFLKTEALWTMAFRAAVRTIAVDCRAILRAGAFETFREGEPPCEPSADGGSHGASPSPRRSRGSNRAKYRRLKTNVTVNSRSVACLSGASIARNHGSQSTTHGMGDPLTLGRSSNFSVPLVHDLAHRSVVGAAWLGTVCHGTTDVPSAIVRHG
jgi:hypothetical protein